MALSDVAQISVATSGSPVSRPGFGTTLIADPCLAWGASQDRVRVYKSTAAMLSDGWLATDGAYKAAVQIFSQQSPSAPQKVKVGRRALKPTQRWTLVPTAQDSTTYRVTIDGVDCDFVSGVGTTVALIIAGMKTAIDAKAIAGITTTNVGPNTSLQITATVAGAWHSLKAMRVDVPTAPSPILSVNQDHADPGIATDLGAIALADSDWYGLALTHASKAEVLAAAAWVEANQKLFIQGTQDSDTRTTAPGGADMMATAKASSYARTSLWYHPDNAAFIGAALQGARLPTDPGSENWEFVTLAGVSTVTLTATEQQNLAGKNGNFYYDVVSGKSVTSSGLVSDAEFIDVIRFRDWLAVNMGLDIVDLQTRMAAQGRKVPMDDNGIAAVQSVILARLRAGVLAGGLSASPAPTCTVPRAADMLPADRAARKLTGVQFTGQLSGAVNLTVITGVLN